MTTKSLFCVDPTIVPVRLLLVVLVSAKRLDAFAVAVIVWLPAVATQYLAPDWPPFAVSVTEAPGANDALLVSEKRFVPSILNPTPTILPAGVATVPWFLTVALGTTCAPIAAVAGLIAVTIKSGLAGASAAEAAGAYDTASVNITHTERRMATLREKRRGVALAVTTEELLLKRITAYRRRANPLDHGT